jgi:hypothetical protein
MDCFRLRSLSCGGPVASLATTCPDIRFNCQTAIRMQVRIPAARCARGLRSFDPLSEKRAQGRPGARCTRGLVCKLHKRKRTRAYRFSGGNPAFPAQWFYGLLRALPGDRLSCHRHFVRTCPTKLSASTGAPGPHDFAVRELPCVRLRKRRVHRIPPRVGDVAQRPSHRVRRAES